MELWDLSEVSLKSRKPAKSRKLGRAKMPMLQARIPDLAVCCTENHPQV